MTGPIGRAPLVSFGRAILSDPEAALRREWLVTNGLGGYASAAVDGTPIRRYSGWLVAALEPPVARTVLVGGLLEVATVAGRRCRLGSLERRGRGADRFEPDGRHFQQAFELDGMRPTWTFQVGDTRLLKLAWMAHGSNTTYVSYTMEGGGPIELEVTPLLTARDHHDLRPEDDRRPAVDRTPAGLAVRWPDGPAVTTLLGPGAEVRASPAARWIRGIVHRAETDRGEHDVGALLPVGAFRVTLQAGDAWTLILTAEDPASVEPDAARALAEARDRDAALLALAAGAGTPTGDPVTAQLVLAADQFIVQRRNPGVGQPGRTVIAGYPWFNDWGRDTMIALPGLTLATGRFDEASRILRSFAPWVRDGLVPNNFPDAERAKPGYHTVDAALWYVHAVEAYRAATGDRAIVADLLPVLLSIVDAYARGTRFGIGVDPGDGLVRAGAPGWQLTWMDAKVGDWVVTPRMGKPVEIQALWIHACRLVARWAADAGNGQAADRCGVLARRAAASFAARFWRPDLGHLADVVDGPDGDDSTLRPNQLLAVVLEPDLLPPDQARAVVESCARHLAVPGGLRSLDPRDPAYRGRYAGPRLARDAVYHQGTAWTWLVGPLVAALVAVGAPPEAVAPHLAPLRAHFDVAGLGTVGELVDGDPPHDPEGCIAQAWGVAESLRAMCLVARARREHGADGPSGADPAGGGLRGRPPRRRLTVRGRARRSAGRTGHCAR